MRYKVTPRKEKNPNEMSRNGFQDQTVRFRLDPRDFISPPNCR